MTTQVPITGSVPPVFTPESSPSAWVKHILQQRKDSPVIDSGYDSKSMIPKRITSDREAQLIKISAKRDSLKLTLLSNLLREQSELLQDIQAKKQENQQIKTEFHQEHFNLMKERPRLQADRTYEQGQLAALEKNKEILKEEVAGFQADCAARLQQGSEELPKIEREVDGAKADYQALQSENDKLQPEVDGAKADYQALQSEYDKLQREADGAKADYKALQSEYDKLQPEADGAKADYKALQSEYDKLQREADGAKADYQALQSEYNKDRVGMNIQVTPSVHPYTDHLPIPQHDGPVLDLPTHKVIENASQGQGSSTPSNRPQKKQAGTQLPKVGRGTKNQNLGDWVNADGRYYRCHVPNADGSEGFRLRTKEDLALDQELIDLIEQFMCRWDEKTTSNTPRQYNWLTGNKFNNKCVLRRLKASSTTRVEDNAACSNCIADATPCIVAAADGKAKVRSVTLLPLPQKHRIGNDPSNFEFWILRD